MQNLMHVIKSPCCLVNELGVILAMNQPCERLLKPTGDSLVGTNLTDSIKMEKGLFEETLQRVGAEVDIATAAVIVPSKNKVIGMELCRVTMPAAKTILVSFVSTKETVSHCVLSVKRDGTIIAADSGFCRLGGLELSDIVGHPVKDFLKPSVDSLLWHDGTYFITPPPSMSCAFMGRTQEEIYMDISVAESLEQCILHLHCAHR